jgi:hypothetical protein
LKLPLQRFKVRSKYCSAVESGLISCTDPRASPAAPESDAGERDTPTPSIPAPTKFRSLDLPIEDFREQPASKFIQDITIQCISDLATGEWLVNTKDFLSALKEIALVLTW